MDSAGMVMLTIGLLLLVFAPVIGIGFRRSWRSWPRVTATVTKVKERKRTENNHEVTDIWITYRFTDTAGAGRSGSTMVLRRPKKRAEITVRYDPEHPEVSSPTAGDRPLQIVLLGILPAAGVVLVVWGFLRLHAG